MPKILLLCSLFLWLRFSTYAQSTDTSSLTSVTTKSGTVYTGKIIENVDGQYVRIKASDNNVYRISYDMISQMRTISPNAPAPAAVNKSPGQGKPQTVSNGVIYYKNIPEELQRKKNKGVVLTAIGSSLIGVGIIIIAASPADVQTYHQPGASGVNFGGVAALGALMVLAGIPTMIVGAVKLGVTKRKIHRYLMLHEN